MGAVMRDMMVGGGDKFGVRVAKHNPGLWMRRNYSPERNLNATTQRQLGSQISMFQVAGEIG